MKRKALPQRTCPFEFEEASIRCSQKVRSVTIRVDTGDVCSDRLAFKDRYKERNRLGGGNFT